MLTSMLLISLAPSTPLRERCKLNLPNLNPASVITCTKIFIIYLVLSFSSQGGARVNCSNYDGLVELATICALCNDSSLDYNEV